ncbi:AraC family transcriptional regulator [Paenibacillus sp. CC-CFT747]|nr:AraC family transcriptional regulator [Paenibacillus sp. CC-CFT747]
MDRRTCGEAVRQLGERRPKADKALELKITRFIEDNLYNELSLETVAEHVRISPNYLSRLFKGMLGMTFLEYVTDKKLRRAGELLLYEKMTVQDVSAKLGYQSTHYFIRIFKERYGLTPKQFQKLNAGKELGSGGF